MTFYLFKLTVRTWPTIQEVDYLKVNNVTADIRKIRPEILQFLCNLPFACLDSWYDPKYTVGILIVNLF